MVIKKSNKKLLLSLAVFSVVLMTAFAFAGIGGVVFTSPLQGANISGTYNVAWTNTEGYILYLQAGQGGCNPSSWTNLSGAFVDPNVTSYSWNTASLNGQYCLRLITGTNTTETGNFTIDNTDPVANLSAGEPYSCNEGDNVTLDASASTDADTGIASYEWNTGSGYVSGGVTYNYTCGDGPNTPTVFVRVTDFAGNTDTNSTTVNISNVAPVCYGITSVADTVVDQNVNFTANATDVIDSLNYSWDFNDSSTGTGNPGTHAFSTEGTYTVKVTVSDGDGGTCENTTTINAHGITVLLSQEAVALQNLATNFGTKNGSVANSFTSGLTGPITCTETTSTPVDLTNSSTDCVVTWNNINNSDHDSHLVSVQVYNGSDYKYYQFNITVYSWAIELAEGWNLISIPLVPSSTAINDVFSDIVDTVDYVDSSTYTIQMYDATNNKWYKARPYADGSAFTGPSSYKLTTIVPGYAYWVKMGSADTLYGFGNKSFGALSTPPTVDLGSGWNLIGKFGLVSVQKQNEIDDLVFYDEPQLMDLANYTISDSNGDTIAASDDLVATHGYWTLLGGNSGNPTKYTASEADYNFN